MIWLGIVAYVVLGAAYAIEASARLEAYGVVENADWEWHHHEFVLVGVAALFWPLALLAMAWYAGFEWRTEQLKKRIDAARG